MEHDNFSNVCKWFGDYQKTNSFNGKNNNSNNNNNFKKKSATHKKVYAL